MSAWDIFGVPSKTKSHDPRPAMKYSHQVVCHSFEIFAPVKEVEVAADDNNEIRESKVDYMDQQEELMKTKKQEPEIIRIDLSDEANNQEVWEEMPPDEQEDERVPIENSPS